MSFNHAMCQGWGGFSFDTSTLNRSYLTAGTETKTFEKEGTKSKQKLKRDQTKITYI